MDIKQAPFNANQLRPRTIAEAADELGLSPFTVRSWVAQRRLGYLRLGRAVRIPAAEIQRVLAEAATPARPGRADTGRGH